MSLQHGCPLPAALQVRSSPQRRLCRWRVAWQPSTWRRQRQHPRRQPREAQLRPQRGGACRRKLQLS